MTRKPTARQLEIHAWMMAYQRQHGAPPSIRELGERFGIRSTNGVTDHMKALARHGMVTRRPGAVARGYVAISRLSPTGEIDHEWLRGFAAAVGLFWVVTRDPRAVRAVLERGGVSLDALGAVGTQGCDVEAIRAAIVGLPGGAS